MTFIFITFLVNSLFKPLWAKTEEVSCTYIELMYIISKFIVCNRQYQIR